MKWELLIGSDRKFLEKQQASGKRVKLLDDEPVIYPDLIPVWRAFHFLNSARPANGMSQSPIPVSDISAYFDIIGLKATETKQEFLHLIRALDEEYLLHFAEKMKAERKLADAKSKSANQPTPRR